MNFGPIKEGYTGDDGWIEVKKVTVFIGDQGSGKSTVAKLISTLTWLEKSMNRGDTDKVKTTFAKFKELFEYHKINNYFTQNTYIEYLGERYHIVFDSKKEKISISADNKNNYIVPQIMYIPAERNFLSTISDAYNVKGLSDNVFTFAEELKKAQKELKGKKIKLPIQGYFYEYDENEDLSYVIGSDYKVNLVEASSGLQSFIPLYLVSNGLSSSLIKSQEKRKKEMTVTQAVRLANEIMEIMNNGGLTDKEKSKQTSLVKAKYISKCFINIIEEPEQNLFPASQKHILYSLLEFNNINEGNKLIITTHSPYLINFLSIAIQGAYLLNKIKENPDNIVDTALKYNLINQSLTDKLNDIVPIKSVVKSSDVAIYELNEKNGIIAKLPDFEGIPSDKNYLNQSLKDGNEMFDSLLSIEQEL